MEATDLRGLLEDYGIRGLRSLAPDHTEQVVCPKCQGGRTREKSLSVTIDQDGMGAVWECKRGKCLGFKGGKRLVVNLDNFRRRQEQAEPRKPPPEPPNPEKPDWMYRFFFDRKIGARTVDKLGIYAQTRNFPPPVGRSECIVFPYVWRGEVRNHKYRPHPAKQPQQQDRDALPTLYNADAIKAAEGGTLYWVEGEPDVAAMVECGFANTVSLKDGAPAPNSRQDDKRFAAFTTHAEELEKVNKHVIATDMDGPGRALAEEIARRVGRHKAFMVEWPQGCKDACDVLRDIGLEEIQSCIAAATPYPISGIFEIDEDEIMSFIDAPPIPVLTTGAMASDDAGLRFPSEGRLIVLTGFANQGKTTYSRFVMVHHIRKHGRKWLVFSPEHMPPAQFYREVAETWIGKPIRNSNAATLASATKQELAEALVRLKPNLKVLAADSVDTSPTLDWLLERATAMVLRDGITDFLIDPWNEVEHERGGMSETDYIGRALQRLRAWAARHGCNVWISPHPSKPPPLRNGEKRKPPDGYDISGSAHWMNKPDLGLTIWSQDIGISEIYVWKAKHFRWGRRGTTVKLEFNEHSRQYASPSPGLPSRPEWEYPPDEMVQ